MAFKSRLKFLREKKGLTHSQVGAIFGKSEGAVRSWEMSRSAPDMSTIIRLAEYFDCTTDFLLGLSDFRSREEKAKYDSDIEPVLRHIEKYPENARDKLTSMLLLTVEVYDALTINKDLQSKIFTDMELLLKTLCDIANSMGATAQNVTNADEVAKQTAVIEIYDLYTHYSSYGDV